MVHKSQAQWKEIDNLILKTVERNDIASRQSEVTITLITETINCSRQKSREKEMLHDLQKQSFDPKKIMSLIDHESQLLIELTSNLSKLSQVPNEIKNEASSLLVRVRGQIKESSIILSKINKILELDNKRNSSKNGITITTNNNIHAIDTVKKSANHNMIREEESFSTSIVHAAVPLLQNTENSSSTGTAITNSTRKRKPNTKIAYNDLEHENSAKKKRPVSNDRKRRRSEEGKNKPKGPNVKADDKTESIQQQQVEEKKKPSGLTVKIKDRCPNRITNPLLEMPYYQSLPKQTAPGSLPVETIPQGAEFWSTMPIYFPEPDTYPLSYMAKILGFDPLLVNESVEGSSKIKDFASLRANQCKNDEWAKLPVLGNFSVHLEGLKSMKSKENREGIPEIDPMWTAILAQYRGFRDDQYKPSSEIKKDNVILDECISFAKRIKLLNEKIQFRTATLDDIASLNELNTVKHPDNEAQAYCNNFFGSTIRCGSQFIIVAESKTAGIIGYVHYRFCWFRQKPESLSKSVDTLQNSIRTISTLTPKSMAERTLHIDDVKSKQGCSENCADSVINIVLISLAIEHARRFVVYGMMETESTSAPFFKTYFRMREIEDKDADERHKTFLAIDLESCNYRYALLKKAEEMYRKEKDDDNTSPIKSERMLVILPSVQEIIDSGELVERCRPHTPYKVKNDDVCHFPRTERHPGTKRAIVKLSRNQCTVVQPSNQENNDGVGRSNLLGSKQISWNMLRSFPKKPKEKLTDDNQNGQSVSVGVEVQRLQDELVKVENTMLPSLWSLYRNAHEERMEFEHKADKHGQEKSTLKQYTRMMERRREQQEAWELQQQQDDNAVCDVCYDGESTGENRIIFCDSCNISVHQRCYGIEKVPSEDYFCHACTYFKRDKKSEKEESLVPNRRPEKEASRKTSPLPIVCEICPRRQGAFIRVFTKKETKAKWVHVVCAKWLALQYVDEKTGEVIQGNGSVVEDFADMRDYFRNNDYKCCLCEGTRGCFITCSVEGCEKTMHVTCARSSGLCNVNHGANHLGDVITEKSWSLTCPDHSTFDEDHEPAGTAHLRALAKAFPTQSKPPPPPKPPKPPKPPPPPKPFYKMTKKERDHHLADPKYEIEFLQTLSRNIHITRCEICNLPYDKIPVISDEIPYMKCSTCGSTVHANCQPQKWRVERPRNSAPRITCTRCLYVEENETSEDFLTPECHMCNSKHGALIKAVATPISMKKWKSNSSAYKKSYFGRQIWCHPSCGMWHPKCSLTDGTVNCTNIIMANGLKHIDSQKVCNLCGRKDKVKVQCNHTHLKKSCQMNFHVTCARQAGLEVSDVDGNDVQFHIKCFEHAGCNYALRAVLEDMLEMDKIPKSNGYMSFEYASKIFNWGILAMQCLGWAWQWSDWWVHLGDRWEPLLEPGQKEEDMTKEELRIIDSTPESRCRDARRCRLAAFGAALRNRDYDKKEGDDRKPLERALRAVLSTPSLVGPLIKSEIDFFVEWLARVYRSKLPILGFGDHKIPVNETWEKDSCVYFHDETPKFILGNRPLPGKQVLKKGQIFEEGIVETDDFCPEELPLSIVLRSPEKMDACIQIPKDGDSPKKKKSKENSPCEKKTIITRRV